MDRDLVFIVIYLHKLVELHNLLGRMNTLTYNDVYFIQSKIRKMVNHVEKELDIKKERFNVGKFEGIKKFNIDYLRIEE